MQVASRNKITSVIHERSFSIAVQIYGPLRPTIRFIHNRCSYSIIKYISLYNNNFDVKGEQHRSFYMVLCNRPNNNNNNSHDSVYGAVIMTKVIAIVHPVHTMNADWAPGGRQPSDQASQLGLWVRRKLAAIIHIHHHHCYYYLARRLILILPSHEGWKAELT